MTERAAGIAGRDWDRERVTAVLDLAGVRYWTASVLPALVGTTLPFWLRPRGFEFQWVGAVEFLVATVLMHSGFSLLQARFEQGSTQGWSGKKLLGWAAACVASACALGLHLMRLTPDLILAVYGFAVIFAGLLYVAPPVSFSRREGGEIVISMALGLMPLLGGYLVQTGDLTRTVYLAALPIYAAMLLWVWTERMASHGADPGTGRQTLVALFGPRLSGRFVVPGLSALLCATVAAAVLSASVARTALVALVLSVPIWKIIGLSWHGYDDATAMLRAQRMAFLLHLWLCVVLAASSLWPASN